LGLGTDENGNQRSDISNQRFIGQPLYVFYDYKYAGIYQASEAAAAAKAGTRVGQVKIEDLNGSGTVDGADRQIIGTRQPKFEAGTTQRIRFKGFDITAVALTRVGATVVDPLLFPSNYYTTYSGRRNQVNLPYYTTGAPDNAFPQPNQNYFNDFVPNAQSTAYLSGTFIKVRSLDLGYTLPATVMQKLRMATARVYVQVQNPLIWSPVTYYKNNKAIDPEALSYSSRFNGSTANNGGVTFDYGVTYPVTRSFIFGLNLGF
jgi:hypothetical protein